MAGIEKRITDLEKIIRPEPKTMEEIDQIMIQHGHDPNMPIEELMVLIKQLKQEVYVEQNGIRAVKT